MVGADESTELWRHPNRSPVFATFQIEHKFVFSLDAHLQKALQIFHAILQSMEIEIPFGLQAS